MFRWLRRILVGVSFLLLLACAGMWVRSQWATHTVRHSRFIGHAAAARKIWWGIYSQRGSLVLGRGSRTFDELTDSDFARLRNKDQPYLGWRIDTGSPGSHRSIVATVFRDPVIIGRWGFCWESGSRARSGKVYSESFDGRELRVRQHTYRSLALPWWFLILLFSLAPAVSFLRRRRRRRVPAGCCRGCGYDLRATPAPASTGGAVLAVCPECGRDTSGKNTPAPLLQ